jgi:hypothetical protein
MPSSKDREKRQSDLVSSFLKNPAQKMRFGNRAARNDDWRGLKELFNSNVISYEIAQNEFELSCPIETTDLKGPSLISCPQE